MATWTTLPDSSLEPGKPIRSIDALALRDNPVAISEGASGAPRILDAALGSTATTAGTNWVLARNALASVGAIGTYAFLQQLSGASVSPGGTLAGSSLRYANVFGDSSSSGTPIPSGTWRCMGFSSRIFTTDYPISVWLRIS
jgi:hypothetical protein